MILKIVLQIEPLMDGVDIDERNRTMQLQEKHWPTSVHEQAAIKSRQKQK